MILMKINLRMWTVFWIRCHVDWKIFMDIAVVLAASNVTVCYVSKKAILC